MVDRITTDSSESAPLVVVGSVAFDNVITPYGSQEGILEVPLLTVRSRRVILPQPRMVGVIGNDFGDEYLDRLRKRGIDLEGVQKDRIRSDLFLEREIP